MTSEKTTLYSRRQFVKTAGVALSLPTLVPNSVFGKDAPSNRIVLGFIGCGKQSKHFVCTSCHNIQKEDPDLSIADPQARLEYARDMELPYLPGTTLYGAVNRTSFYNGDYEKKYGDLVKPARNNLREAIQLCAVECSQGRALRSHKS